jgi:hypothetical protein
MAGGSKRAVLASMRARSGSERSGFMGWVIAWMGGAG